MEEHLPRTESKHIKSKTGTEWKQGQLVLSAGQISWPLSPTLHFLTR